MEKVGRNDPCPCGSGKKFKSCCLTKVGGSGVKRKLTAKWLNPKQAPEEQKVEHKEVDLMDRTFGHATKTQSDEFQPIMPKVTYQGRKSMEEKENTPE